MKCRPLTWCPPGAIPARLGRTGGAAAGRPARRSAAGRGARLAWPLCLLALWPALAGAQAAPAPAAVAPGMAAPSPAAPGAAAPGAAAAGPAAPAPEMCRRQTDLATAADLKAATLMAQRGDPQQTAATLDTAMAAWTAAGLHCEGRARDRAQRNLADSRQLRQTVGEQLGGGAACEAGHKDATALQDLARNTLAERRWADAALLFRKAEGLWDLASERCLGAQQQLARQRREQTETDAHNAEHCAPRFDPAREASQRFRQAAATLPAPERQRQSLVAETLWRDALPHCRGAALDLARTQAEALARERGSPWVATRDSAAPALPATVLAAAPAPGSGLAPAAPARAAAPTVPTSPSANGGGPLAAALAAPASTATAPPATPPATPFAALSAALSAVTASTPTAATSAAASAATSANPPVAATTGPAAAAAPGPQDPAWLVVDQRLADGTRLQGRFSRDTGLTRLTGRGTLTMPSGDVYEGELLAGRRHGQGEQRWADGQTYRGQWEDDLPHGEGVLQLRNGDRFEGSVRAGSPQGAGRMYYASGDSYQGLMAQGRPEGAGLYVWADGQRCQCLWRAGQAMGPGVLRFPDGRLYEGPLHDGRPHGQGRLAFASGDRYEGEFVHGLFEGQGVYTWKAGDVYTGEWKAGLKEGRGDMRWPNGDRWVGRFRADAQTDEGSLQRGGRAAGRPAPRALPAEAGAAVAANPAPARPAATPP